MVHLMREKQLFCYCFLRLLLRIRHGNISNDVRVLNTLGFFIEHQTNVWMDGWHSFIDRKRSVSIYHRSSPDFGSWLACSFVWKCWFLYLLLSVICIIGRWMLDCMYFCICPLFNIDQTIKGHVLPKLWLLSDSFYKYRFICHLNSVCGIQVNGYIDE